MLTRFVFAVTALAFLLAPAPTLAAAVPVEGEGGPELYVAKVHADWCGSCQTLVPILEEVRAAVADEPVLFVQLDVTDSTRTAQARLLAAALGVEEHLKANNKTGLVLLIDAGDKSLLETVTKKNTAAEIVGKIEERLAAAQARRDESAPE
ncbi:MAG: thioredoxin domain-containing protein [Gemmatimonadaceae bacterium]|nr:thioredoxin domain-containing protein [Gemmatimonadaceae bacterium]